MTLNKLRDLMDKIDECDETQLLIEKATKGSPGMKKALIGATIQRKNNLLDRIHAEFGIDLEV